MGYQRWTIYVEESIRRRGECQESSPNGWSSEYLHLWLFLPETLVFCPTQSWDFWCDCRRHLVLKCWGLESILKTKFMARRRCTGWCPLTGPHGVVTVVSIWANIESRESLFGRCGLHTFPLQTTGNIPLGQYIRMKHSEGYASPTHTVPLYLICCFPGHRRVAYRPSVWNRVSTMQTLYCINLTKRGFHSNHTYNRDLDTNPSFLFFSWLYEESGASMASRNGTITSSNYTPMASVPSNQINVSVGSLAVGLNFFDIRYGLIIVFNDRFSCGIFFCTSHKIINWRRNIELIFSS